MDIIDKELSKHALNDTYAPSVRAAASLGKKTLNHYYNKTDDTKIYRIAMGKSCYNLLSATPGARTTVAAANSCSGSSSPQPQAEVLPRREVGARLDQDGARHGTQ